MNRLTSKSHPFFVLLFLLLSGTYGFSQSESWDLEIDKNDIKVYSRPIQGSQLKEVRGEAEFNCSAQTYIDYMGKFDQHTEWVTTCTQSTILEQSHNELVVHYVFETPWPFEDREVIARCKMKEKAGGAYQFSYLAEPTYKEKNPPITMMRKYNTTWTVTPTSDSSCKIELKCHTDPGVKVPDFLINMASKEPPYKSLMILKKLSCK